MTLRLLLALLAIVCVACGSEPAAPRCELGRSSACTCSSGGAGAQECGPSGVWSPCVCAALDAAPVDVAVAVDAPADTAPDVAHVDAASDVAVVERDVPGLDVAVDASPAADADAAVDAPPPIGDAPPALADHIERMQVWESINGSPPAYVPSGVCVLSASNANVFVRVPLGTARIYDSMPPLVTTQCPASITTDRAAEPLVRYRVAGAVRANASASAAISPPDVCGDDMVRVSTHAVWAFGCPMAP